MNDRPRIAVPLLPEQVYANYFDALRAFGARGLRVGADVNAASFDGLLLPGGADIDPARYGRPNTASRGIRAELDAIQFAALDAFVKAKKPVFGICRGHQLINVYFGGTLVQDLPEGDAHRWDPVTDEDRTHDTVAEPGSVLARLYGPRFPVNSAHHQGVEAVGAGLRVTQRAPDGVVEALEHESLPVFCVEWHPERMCLGHARPDTVDGGAIIEYFIKMCK